MIGVRVADDDVLDRGRIETQLLQAADDFFFGVISEQRVDEDDALAGGQGPRRVDLGAYEIEVVEHLGGFGEPSVSSRRGSRRHIPQSAGNRRWRNA